MGSTRGIEILLCCNPNFFRTFFTFFLLLLYLYNCKAQEETGSAGEQPASNKLYGWTASWKGYKCPSFLNGCRNPMIAWKTQAKPNQNNK